MNFYKLIIQNLINLPLMCFLVGGIIGFIKPSLKFPRLLKNILTISILFLIGLKGGAPLFEHAQAISYTFFALVCCLVIYSLVQPVISFYILKAVTKIDHQTAAAVAACFGSISVVTLITAISFLDQLNISYQSFIIAGIAVMDIPAIMSGLFLANKSDPLTSHKRLPFIQILKSSIMNKAIISIFCGLIVGGFLAIFGQSGISSTALSSFKPLLSVFLLDMGLSVGIQRNDLKSFSIPLSLFGLYMPLIGGFIGLAMSYFIHLDPGTGLLMAVLCASASYIAVPAAMKMALPQAKEALYLPLSLAVAFPFNIIIGIPLYYYIATIVLKR